MRKPLRAIALLLAVGGLSACAYHDDYAYRYGSGYGGYDAPYGDYRYDGDDYAYGDRDYDSLGGSGADIRDPWLALTPEGREIVAMGFDGDDDGRITEDTAYRANVWFRRYADTDDDLRLTDAEIRLALVQGALYRPWEGGY